MRIRILTKVLKKGQEALHDLSLLKIVQSEISHELSSNHFQDVGSGALGDFVVDWDSLGSRDVVLRSKSETGEEVIVSALLGPLPFDKEIYEDGVLPRDVSMKICVKKPGLRSALQFDCEVHKKGRDGSEYNIHNASYLQSLTAIGNSAYQGPVFSHLDPRLQESLKDYLVAKGVGESLTNFLLLHLHKKEQGQYVDWLKKLESMVLQVD